MEGIALAVRLLPFLAAFVLVTAVVVVYLLSPKSWPRVKRWSPRWSGQPSSSF
jgi:hypothetical protein